MKQKKQNRSIQKLIGIVTILLVGFMSQVSAQQAYIVF